MLWAVESNSYSIFQPLLFESCRNDTVSQSVYSNKNTSLLSLTSHFWGGGCSVIDGNWIFALKCCRGDKAVVTAPCCEWLPGYLHGDHGRWHFRSDRWFFPPTRCQRGSGLRERETLEFCQGEDLWTQFSRVLANRSPIGWFTHCRYQDNWTRCTFNIG